MSAGGVTLVTLSDLTWSLQNNITGWFGLDWTVNLLGSLIKRFGDQHALREFGSSEGLSAPYAGNWGVRRGGMFSPRGRVWTFQHIVWSSRFDFDELRTAHVLVPSERDPAKVRRPTLYGTVLRVDPSGKLDGKAIDLPGLTENGPFLLRATPTVWGAIAETGLRGWTQYGGRAEPCFPGSLLPRFPVGGLHLDATASSLMDAASRQGGQLTADSPAGTTQISFQAAQAPFYGQASPGDRFVVEGDDQTYVVTGTVAPAGDTISAVPFTPPSVKPWKKGGDVEFREAFATPAPQDGTVIELEGAGAILRSTLEPQVLLLVPARGLGVSAGDRYYLVDAAGNGQLAMVARADEGPAITRVRLHGDGIAALAPGALSVRGVSATPSGEAAVVLTRVEDHRLAVPASSPDYQPGDALSFASTPVTVAAVSALAVDLDLDAPLDSLSGGGSVALLDVVAGETELSAKLGDGGKVIDFGAAPAGGLPAGGAILLVSGAAKLPVVAGDKVDDHTVRIDRAAGAAGDAVKVRTLTKKADLGREPKSNAPTLSYTPTRAGTAPAVDGFVLIDAGGRQARRVTKVGFDGLVIDRVAPAGSPAATRFPKRVSKLDGAGLAAQPIWILAAAGLAKDVRDRMKALALHGFQPLPTGAVAAGLLPASAIVAAKVVTATPAGGATLTTALTVGQLARATVGTTSVFAVPRRIQLDLTLDRPLPPELGSDGVELVPLTTSGPSYAAVALAALRVTVRPEASGAAGVQTEMPRVRPGQLVQIHDSAAPADRAYRVASVSGTTLSLEHGPDLTGPFAPAPAVRFTRLDALDPTLGSSRVGLAGTVLDAARTRIRVDVWRPGAIPAGTLLAAVGGGAAAPTVVASVDALRIELDTEAALPDGAIALEVPTPAWIAWSAVFSADGDDLVLDDALVATAGAVKDVVAVPYQASARSLAVRFSSGTVKVPDRLDDQYDLDREQALREHELHHTVQGAEQGPLLLSMIPMWAIEIIAEAKTGEARTKFKEGWDTYAEIVEGMSVGGVLDFLVGTVWGGALWLAALPFVGLNRLLQKNGDGGPLNFLDPFALQYFPATVSDGGDTITIGQRDGKSLALAVGDRVQLKKPSDHQPLSFFSNTRTVKQVNADGSVQLDQGKLPSEGKDTNIGKIPGSADDPRRAADNAMMRGLGMGWMSVLFDPWGELSWRAEPDTKTGAGKFANVLLHIARYAFGSHGWGLVLFSGYAFWDNLRRQWGFLAAKKPWLADMEQGASYYSGDTYYPLGLLRASGEEAALLDDGKLYVGDVAQSWYVISGGDRLTGTVVSESRFAASEVPTERMIQALPFRKDPGSSPSGAVNHTASIGAPAPGLALPDLFFRKNTVDPSMLPSGIGFTGTARGSIPTSPELERAQGQYVAFCRPTPAAGDDNRHRVTLLDKVGQGGQAREAWESGVGLVVKSKVELIHDLVVLDATVRVGSHAVAEGDELPLLPWQEAVLEVSPNGARRYDLTVMRPDGTDGATLRRLEAAGALSLGAGGAGAAEPVEVSRVYRYTDGKGFDGGGLVTYGLHLPSDVHVPVRRFTARVDPAATVRDKPDPDAPARDTFTPGETAYVLVPSALRPPQAGKPNPRLSLAFTGAGPATAVQPTWTVDLAAVDPTADPKLVAMFRHGGRVLAIALPDGAPPEEEVKADLAVQVGPDDASAATVTASFKVHPHFTLQRAAGDFTVAHGASIDLTCSDGVTAGKATATPPGDVTVTAAGATVTVKADGAPRTITLLVEDAANPKRKAARTIVIT